VSTTKVSTSSSLDTNDELGKLGLTLFFDPSESTSAEEDLGKTNGILVLSETDLLDQIDHSRLDISGRAWDALAKEVVALEEISIEHTVGITLTSDTDTLEHTIATKLIEHDTISQASRLLLVVGKDATDEVGAGKVESVHEGSELFLVLGTHSHEHSGLLPATESSTGTAADIVGKDTTTNTKVLLEETTDEVVLGLLHATIKITLKRITVLLDPISDSVSHETSVVLHTNFGLAETILAELGVTTALAKVAVKKTQESVISSAGEHRLLIKQSKDTGRGLLLDKVDNGLTIETEIDEVPLDLLTHVLLLLQLEHVVVEELLKLLVSVVDAKLLEAVVLEDLETGDIEHTDEEGTTRLSHGVIDLLDQPQEKTVVDGLCKSITRGKSLLLAEMLGNPISTGLDTGLNETLAKVDLIDTEEFGRDGKGSGINELSARRTLLHISVTKVKDTSDDLPDASLIILIDAVKGKTLLQLVEIGSIINTLDGEVLTLIDVVELGCRAKTKLLAKFLISTGKKLVEDVEVTLTKVLTDHTALLKQVALDGSTNDVTRAVELDLDELTETRRVVIADSASVTEGLKHGVSLKQLLLELTDLALTGDNGEVLDNLLGVLGLTGTGLTSDQHGLVLVLVEHCTVGLISDGEHVGRLLIATTATIAIDGETVVDGESLVRIQHHKEETRVGVDNVTVVTNAKVVEHTSLVQVTELGAILHTIELGGVTLEGVLLLDSEGVTLSSLDSHIITALLDDFTSVVGVLILRIGVEPNVVLSLRNSEQSLRTAVHKISVKVLLCSVIGFITHGL
jgi:hypothetical protein